LSRRKKKEEITQCDTEQYRTKLINKLYFMEDGESISINQIAGDCDCSQEKAIETIEELLRHKRINGILESDKFTVKK
jgi:redox-regulated HSP33 family molecular chaperone